MGFASSHKTNALLLESPGHGVQRWQEDDFFSPSLSSSHSSETCDNMTIGAYKLLNNPSKKHQISPEVLSFVTVNQNQDLGHNFFLKLWSQQH